MTHRIALALLLSGVGPALLNAAETPSPALLVLSKGDLTLSTVDPTTLQVIGRVPSGPDPHEVIASTDGRVAYISNYGGGHRSNLLPIEISQQP